MLRRPLPSTFGSFATSLALVLSCASFALAQDFQVVEVGNGLPDGTCVRPGPDNTLQSSPVGDDRLSGSGLDILSGPNGICQTPLAGGSDDERPANITLNGGVENARIIIAGAVGSNNGICDSPITAAGDDIVRLAPGTSTPRQVGVRRGSNGVIDSTPGGDDVTTSLVCPGPDLILNSTPGGDDVVVINDPRCLNVCAQTQACIVPGVNDTLDTTVNAADEARPYVSTGADGICQTTASGDDGQFIAVGNGILDAICVDAGADGIAQTSLCGNSYTDVSEQCDTGGDSATCDFDCTLVACGDSHVNAAAGEQCDTGSQSATCDGNCTLPVCGDGTLNTLAGEQCDDGNTSPNDGCNATCQTEFCGDGITQTGIGEQCDTAGNSPTCDANCTNVVCGDGFHNPAAGEQCDDGNISPNDGCNATCQTEFCGDGIIQSGLGEQCDDGGSNSNTVPDACRTNCQPASCGDGVVDPGNFEQCDDGNNKNNDDCLVGQGCVLAVCGDSVKKTKGTPPLEECDDGNVATGDGCDDQCLLEPTPGCGDGSIDSVCTLGTVGATCTTNGDCDVTLGDGVCTTEECDDGNSSNKDDCLNNCVLAACGDGFLKTKGTGPIEGCDDGNTQPGDGCSATCVRECGNGVIDGTCSEGTVGAFCANNADCDVVLGDGVCVTEECDTAIDGLCAVSPPTCSSECTLASCGNGVVECNEQCDLASSNGVLGSGCTIDCERNLVGSIELKGKRECPGAWTLDSPPQDLKRRSQRCRDGDPCDFDAAVDGQCTFSVGICVNRPEPASCTQAPVIAVDLLKLRTADPVHAAAAETLTDALGLLTSDSFEAPGRCREGIRHKNCTVNTDCDSFLGAGDGICDVATGVAYTPLPLTNVGIDANQTTACTPGQLVVVPAATKLALRLHVRRAEGARGDKDSVRLICID